MFRSAMVDNEVVVNNPAIWRPILGINDAVNAYIRAIEANQNISGIFNIASGNYTVGEVGDMVKETLEEEFGFHIKLNIKNIQDFRNYKVDFEKAKNVLSIKPKEDVKSIIRHLIHNKESFKNFENPNYYNIQIFKNLNFNDIDMHALPIAPRPILIFLCIWCCNGMCTGKMGNNFCPIYMQALYGFFRNGCGREFCSLHDVHDTFLARCSYEHDESLQQQICYRKEISHQHACM